MRVGIYNRWVRTAGGGEKHSLGLAELLSATADVDLLTPDPVDLRAIGERLRLDLARVRRRRIPARDEAATAASADYDLFVNATYMAVPVSRARRSLFLVFFPNQLFGSAHALRKARLADGLGRALRCPRWLDGVHAAEQSGARLGRW